MSGHLTPTEVDQLIELTYGAIDAAVQAERSGARWGHTGTAADRATYDADYELARAAERALKDAIRAHQAPYSP